MRETQVELAVAGVVTPEMASVARDEGLDADLLRTRVAEGRIVLTISRNRKANLMGIGMGLRTFCVLCRHQATFFVFATTGFKLATTVGHPRHSYQFENSGLIHYPFFG